MIDVLKKTAKKDTLRLHTPGHKGALCELDLTELTDGSFPGGAIAESEAAIAAHYGVSHAQMLCGGSSQGVKAGIFFAAKNGVCDINSHRSVFDGFRLSGKTAVVCGSSDIRPITVKDIHSALKKDTGMVVVTSPTYFGYCADIDGISEFCKRRGLLFMVDGAHGAHFGSSPLLPPRFAHKCDICNLSTHKTLFALTQTAVLLDGLSQADHAALAEAVKIMGTTSPSYLLYASVADAVKRAGEEQTAERYQRLFDAIAQLKAAYPFLQNDDFTRLVLDCGVLGKSSKRLNGLLSAEGVMSELVTEKYIVFLFTAADTPDTVEALGRALATAIARV